MDIRYAAICMAIAKLAWFFVCTLVRHVCRCRWWRWVQWMAVATTSTWSCAWLRRCDHIGYFYFTYKTICMCFRFRSLTLRLPLALWLSFFQKFNQMETVLEAKLIQIHWNTRLNIIGQWQCLWRFSFRHGFLAGIFLCRKSVIWLLWFVVIVITVLCIHTQSARANTNHKQ